MVVHQNDDEFLREIAQIMRNPAVPHFDPQSGEKLMVSPLSYCVVCTTPVDATYDYCYQCNSARETYADELPDIVLPLTYAGSTDQSRMDVYRYKDVPPSDGGVRRLSILLYFFLSKHRVCLHQHAGLPITSVIAVPSSKGRKDHPLRNFFFYFPEHVFTVDAVFKANPRTMKGDSICPDDFALTRRVDGEHVLILEDTWVKGSNAVSLAIQAKRYGAQYVSVLPLARYLNTGYGATQQWMNTPVASLPFDPFICPVTRGECP